MTTVEQMTQEILKKTGHAPEGFQLIREKNGISVYRCMFREKPAIAKHFAHEEDRREIRHYRYLSGQLPDTIPVYALCESCMLMEDLEASGEWRLGTAEDLSDERTAVLIARWYFLLHRCTGVFHIDYSETELFSTEGIALLRDKLPGAEALWAFLETNLEDIQDALRDRMPVVNYNDFYWTNLAVRKDGTAAMMFDYNRMGRGYVYADVRNVKSSLSEAAGRAFEAEYRKLYRVQYDKELNLEAEKRLDEVLSPVCGLIDACTRAEFPAWAEPLKAAALDGSLLEKAEALVEERKRKVLKRELYAYTPYNEQEEADVREIIRAISDEQENSQTTHRLHLLTDCGREIFTRGSRTMHMTASAWVVSPDRQYVLMAYHNLYNSWAWLGGHADGEADLMAVAQREVMEESGVKHVRPLVNTIFSAEVLTVDGHMKRGKYVPSHLHLNVTYLFEADMDEELAVKEDENSAVAWIPVGEVREKVSEPWMMERIYSKLTEKAARLGRMKKVTLSHDGPPTIYAVPDAAAENLREYCMAFDRWLRESPDAEKYRDERGGICYDEDAFIRYLNEVVFPDEPSFAVCRLGWGERGTEEYEGLPHFNF